MKYLLKVSMPIVFALAVSLSSCSNDYELLDGMFQEDSWNHELNNIVLDFDFLFENSYLQLEKTEVINSKLDSLDFINNETYYPMCYKDLYNFITPVKLDFVMKDTNTIHIPSIALMGIVSSVVRNQENYDKIRLTWRFLDKRFTTIAVFDKENGQLVYDNILTNIPLSHTATPSRRSKLTRSEPGNNNTPTYIFWKDTKTYTYSSDTYTLKIKALCEVKYRSTNDGLYSYRSYKNVNFKFDTPSHPFSDMNSKGEAAKVGDFIIGYIWVGDGSCPFTSTPYYNCSDALEIGNNGSSLSNGEGIVWQLASISCTIDGSPLEDNPTSGEWGF